MSVKSTSGIRHRQVWYTCIDVSEERNTVFTIGEEVKQAGSPNVGKLLPDYTASHRRRNYRCGNLKSKRAHISLLHCGIQPSLSTLFQLLRFCSGGNYE
jgi:hypothetical protein